MSVASPVVAYKYLTNRRLPASLHLENRAVLPGGDIGILAEFDHRVTGKFNDLRFIRFNLEWLMAK